MLKNQEFCVLDQPMMKKDLKQRKGTPKPSNKVIEDVNNGNDDHDDDTTSECLL